MRLETVGRWGERCGYGTREPAAVAPATTASQHVPADHAPRPPTKSHTHCRCRNADLRIDSVLFNW